MLDRPEASECYEYYFTYIDKVPDGDVIAVLRNQLDDTTRFIRELPSDVAGYRYAADKWSVKEIFGHLIDTERTFSFRAMCAARLEPAPMPSLEQDPYVENSRYDERAVEDIAEEYEAVRRASLALYKSFSDEEWLRRATASGWEFTARAIPYIVAGHEIHHRRVIDERYLVGKSAAT